MFKINQLTIKFKLLFLTAGIMTICSICLMIIEFYSQTDQLKKMTKTSFELFEHDFQQEKERQSIMLEANIKTLMSDKYLLKLFANRNRKAVEKRVMSLYQKTLKPALGISQFQFHISPATSFFRAHKPGKFGDDLSRFRQTVLDTNAEKKSIVGFEVGRGGPGLRIVEPLFLENKHIGSVEYGGGIDAILKFAEKRNKVGYSIGIDEEVFKKAKRFADKSKDIIKGNLVFYHFSDKIVRTHLKNLLYSEKMFNDSEGRNIAIHHVPLKDYSGNIIGELTMIKDITDLKKQVAKNIYQQIGFILLATVLLLGLLWLVTTRMIFVPLNILTHFIKALSRGKISDRYPITENNEIGEIARSINQLADALEIKTNLAKKISEGDLTFEITLVSEDDTLGKALQTMEEDLNEMISQIARYADHLSVASTKLADITTAISENTLEVSGQSDTVAGSATEISSNTNTVASGVEEISTSIQNIASTSTQMSQAIKTVSDTVIKMSESSDAVTNKSKHALDVSNQAYEMSNTANSVMKALGDSAQEIGEVTNMIKDIAQQTNLLALNANIEAASAGEAGKGFAVVANEIKELANQSADAAQDIANKVGTIQENSNEAVLSIKEITDIINTIRNGSTEISDMAIHQSEFAQEITRNVTESASGFKEITMLLEEMGNSTKESAISSKELAIGSTEISSNINRVNLSIKEIASKIKDISLETSGLTKLSGLLSEMVDKFNLK